MDRQTFIDTYADSTDFLMHPITGDIYAGAEWAKDASGMSNEEWGGNEEFFTMDEDDFCKYFSDRVDLDFDVIDVDGEKLPCVRFGDNLVEWLNYSDFYSEYRLCDTDRNNDVHPEMLNKYFVDVLRIHDDRDIVKDIFMRWLAKAITCKGWDENTHDEIAKQFNFEIGNTGVMCSRIRDGEYAFTLEAEAEAYGSGGWEKGEFFYTIEHAPTQNDIEVIRKALEGNE